ncbi:MAG: zinc-dependent metalloprotease, partial [Cyanobacteria bacterium J06598_3]
MPPQQRVFRYLIFGLLGWFLVSTLSLALPGKMVFGVNRDLSDWPLIAHHFAAYSQPSPEDLERSGPPEGFRPSGALGIPGESPETLRPFVEVTAELEKQTGLFTTYSDLETGKTYLSLLPAQLNQNFLLVSSIEAGLGEGGLLRGWPINDLLVQFREAPENKVLVLVPNTFVRNPGGQTWQQRLLESSFSDSILFAIDVVSIEPDSQAKLIDLSDLIMTRDLANVKDSLGPALEGYSRSPELSRIDSLRAFENNIEMGTTVGFSADGSRSSFSLASLFGFSLQGLPDDRGFSLGIRYSFSALPTRNGYQPRPADERVGYFISAFRAPPRLGSTDPFVRYIHRWNLEKQTPAQAVSKPKEPIVFWLENTVPPEYRASLSKGVLMWNEAFEQAGFQDAVEVRQMPNNADWDPADIRYNVIRWSDSLRSGVAGLGPSRVNPLTGEILDADIILDANNIRSLQQAYRTLTGGQRAGAGATDGWGDSLGLAATCAQPSQNWNLQWQALQQLGPEGLNQLRNPSGEFARYTHGLEEQCNESVGDQQVAFGALALDMTTHLSRSQLDEYVQQFLIMLTAHEVGHTLGLRHNFAGSGSLPPEALNDLAVTRSQGMTNSIMDYVPPNIAPPGVEQGDFFPTALGAYDIWAIQYGYQTVASSSFPLTATTASAQSASSQPASSQVATLRQIANQGSAPELAYAADEDISDFIDPEVNAWDLSNDPLKFAQWQLDNSQAVW